MNCGEVGARLVDLLYSELSGDESAAVRGHLERCAECHAAWLELCYLASALDRWSAPAPRGITERVLAKLAIREAEAARTERPGMAMRHLVGFLLAGAGAAVLSLLLLGGGQHEGDTPLKLGVVGAIWTILYGGAGVFLGHHRYRQLALAALIAAGLSVLFAPVLSMPAVIEACRRWLEAAQSSVALNAAIVLAGALYASTPIFLSSAILTRARPTGIVSDALRLAGVYGLLLAPSVYLQCHPLTLSLVAPWVAGMLLGSCVGSIGGVSVASRLRLVSS